MALGPAGAVQGQDPQIGGHAPCLGLPVEQQGGGHDHQGWPVQPPGLLFHQQVRQGLRGLAQAHVVGQDAAQVVGAQVLQPGQAVRLVGAQGHSQTLWRWHGLGRAGLAQALGQVPQAGLALQLPAPLRAGPLGLCIGQVLAQAVQPHDVPAADLQRPFFATRVGEEIDQGAHDGLERRGGRIQAAPARCMQADQRRVGYGGDLVGIQPALVTAQQVGDQRGEVQGLTVDLDPQAQEPGAFSTRCPQRLHLGRGRLPVADGFVPQGRAIVGAHHQAPGTHRHALVGEPRSHDDAPAPGLQLRHGIGPEIGEVVLLGQGPQGLAFAHMLTRQCRRAPLQGLFGQGAQTGVPQGIEGVGLGDDIALQGVMPPQGVLDDDGRQAARPQHRGGRRASPEEPAAVGIGPVHRRHGDLCAPRAETTVGHHAQQAIASVEGLQGQARPKAGQGGVRQGIQAQRTRRDMEIVAAPQAGTRLEVQPLHVRCVPN